MASNDRVRAYLRWDDTLETYATNSTYQHTYQQLQRICFKDDDDNEIIINPNHISHIIHKSD